MLYALADVQHGVELELPAGTSVQAAVAASGLLEPLALSERAVLAMAVWGRVVSPEFVLEEGDRVELLRPLRADPKEVRRKRARKAG